MVNKILNLAASQVGYVEGKGNTNKYGESYGWNGVPWCVQFIWWLFSECGAADLFYGGGKIASCTALYNFHKKAGQAVAWSQLRPGDVLFMCFDGEGDTDHVGIVEKVSGGTVTTIEGNTSSGTRGSQSNGEGVYRRTRYKANFVAAYRPAYGGSGAAMRNVGYSAESFIRDVQRAIGAGVDGIVGSETRGKLPILDTKRNTKHAAVAHVQVRLFALGYDVGKYGADGEYGGDTEAAVRRFQTDHGITADGECGPATFGKLFED